MSARGVVELRDLVGRLERLEVECARCGRCGRYRVSGLVARHGPGFDLGQLQQLLTRDCPSAGADHFSERCNVRYPQLSKLWARDRQP